MLKRIPAASVVALLHILVIGPAAEAQTDFSSLHIKPGDTVFVTDSSGATTAGTILTISPRVLRVDGRDFAPTPDLKIQKRGDPVWDGTLKGLLVGAVVGALISGGECGVKWSFARCTAAGAGWGAAFGTVIDWRHVGRTTIFLGADTSRPRSSALRSRSLEVAIRMGM